MRTIVRSVSKIHILIGWEVNITVAAGRGDIERIVSRKEWRMFMKR